MKDIYEFFNDMDIDINEFKEVEADELEKARVKKIVRESIAQRSDSGKLKKRKKVRLWWQQPQS